MDRGENMHEFLPYFVSIITAVIAAVSSVLISRRETKTEIDKLIKQHEFELETEREKHLHELEKQELEHKHQMDMLKVEAENKIGSDVLNAVVSEAMKFPETRNQFLQGMKNSKKRK